MKQYKLVNNISGWLVFLVAAITYCLTVEPTASFWDCPEFITTGYKLEVGHPPGAPFFMLTANFFTQFTNDPANVAYCVNIMSALLSAFCILFLFWSITHLTRNRMQKAAQVGVSRRPGAEPGADGDGHRRRRDRRPGLYVERHVLVLGRRG